jgi:LemA protein
MQAEWILIAILTFIGVYAVTLCNRLARLRRRVRAEWSGIEAQLGRRADLVPPLLETVKPHAAQAHKLFAQITRERAQSIDADDVPGQEAATRALRNSLGRLLALAEASPALKADEKFRGLQRQLAEIEGRLQMARRAYNEAVRDFNIAVRAFPNALLAWPLGFREAPYFEPDDAG